ncbi:MAG: PQQ-binding-like beta-propeller repeat protein [Fuerstiella sp.]
MLSRYIFCLVCATFANAATAADWTQWSGNDRLCNWNESGILDRFPEGGLQPTWTVKIGSGYSGPAVANGRVYVMDYRPQPETKTLEALERLLCLDEKTGDIIWQHEWPTHYRRQLQSYATGPRATPLVDGDRVYTLGATGRIHCTDTATGKVIWEHDALEAFDALVPIFAVSASPIVWKDTVIFPCGGADGLLRALDRKTGESKWKALPARYDMPYCAPEIFEIAGTPQLIQWHKEQLSALNPDDGTILWEIPFTAKNNMAIARPVLLPNDRLLVSGFYDGSMLVQAGRNSARMLWKNGGSGERPNQTKSLHAVITTPIVQGDHFYGTCSYGELRGLQLSDGERIWENTELTRQGRWGSMFWVKNGNRYFVNNDLGELMIMRFSPNGPQLIDRTKLIEPDTPCGYGPRRFGDALVNWVMPAYANKHVIIRNDHEIRRVSLAAH